MAQTRFNHHITQEKIMVRITISGVSRPPSWETIQTVLRESTDTSATLTRISRGDGGVDYRATGAYVLGYRSTTDAWDYRRRDMEHRALLIVTE